MSENYDFGGDSAQTYEKECSCGKGIEVSTQQDYSTEYYTKVYVKWVCGKSVEFELPVN